MRAIAQTFLLRPSVRDRGGRPRRARQRPGTSRTRPNGTSSWSGEDRDRHVRVAAAERRHPERDHVGAPARTWLLNRAVVQPDPAVFSSGWLPTSTVAHPHFHQPRRCLLRMEDAGIMLRIDCPVTPTMAKTPTLATWELDLVRTIDDVIRRGHLRRAVLGLRDYRKSASRLIRSSCTGRPPRAAIPGASDRSGRPRRLHRSRCAWASVLRVPPWPATSKPLATTTRRRTGGACLALALREHASGLDDHAGDPAATASLAMSKETDMRAWSNLTPQPCSHPCGPRR